MMSLHNFSFDKSLHKHDSCHLLGSLKMRHFYLFHSVERLKVQNQKESETQWSLFILYSPTLSFLFLAQSIFLLPNIHLHVQSKVVSMLGFQCLHQNQTRKTII
jgi:hypothetical protein